MADALFVPEVTVIVPDREVVPVFAVTETVASPFPVPLDAPEKPDPEVAVVQAHESALAFTGMVSV